MDKIIHTKQTVDRVTKIMKAYIHRQKYSYEPVSRLWAPPYAQCTLAVRACEIRRENGWRVVSGFVTLCSGIEFSTYKHRLKMVTLTTRRCNICIICLFLAAIQLITVYVQTTESGTFCVSYRY